MLRICAPEHEAVLTGPPERAPVMQAVEVPPPIFCWDPLQETRRADALPFLQAAKCNARPPSNEQARGAG